MKTKFLKIPRYNGKHEVFKYETHPVPERLAPALKEIKAYMRAYARQEKAAKALTPALCDAFKSRTPDDLLEMGDFLTRLHLWSAHYFFERAFKLDPSKIRK